MRVRLLCSVRSRRAFSLLEILVAVTLLTVIVAALIFTFTTTQGAFRLGVSQAEVLESGRSALLLLSRELQMVTSTGQSNAFDFVALRPNSSPPLAQRLPGGETRLNQLQQLTFVSRVNDDWFVTAYRVLDGGLGVGALYRWSASTNVQGVPALVAQALAWQPVAARDSRVVDGLIHFRCVPYATIQGTNGLEVPEASFPSLGGVGYIFPDLRTSTALPTHVDLELALLEPKTLEAFRGRVGRPGFDAAAFLYNWASRVHLFKERIPIYANPPPHSALFSP